MSFEKDFVDEVNQLRKDPKGFADKIEKNKQYFKDKVWMNPETKVGLKTQEGAAAYDDAIEYLRTKAKPAEPFTPSKALFKIAGDFLAEYQKDVDAKIEIDTVANKYGNFEGSFRRLMQFGPGNPEQTLINTIVSDGDTARKEREVLLSDDLKFIGVAHGTHDIYKGATIITLCTKFNNTVDADDNQTF
jgi:hypothetical protein